MLVGWRRGRGGGLGATGPLFSGREEVGGLEEGCRGLAPDLVNKSAENNSLDFS